MGPPQASEEVVRLLIVGVLIDRLLYSDEVLVYQIELRLEIQHSIDVPLELCRSILCDDGNRFAASIEN